MSIDYYVGCDGPCVNVESEENLREIIDILHTQVIDNLGEDSELLKVLENTMKELDNLPEKGDG